MNLTIRALLGVMAFVTVPILAGCGGSSTSLPDPQPPFVSAALPDGLTATLAEDRSSIAVGGVVTYTLALTNDTAQPITYRPVISGPAPSGNVPATLLVKDAGGGTVFPAGALPQFVAIGPSTTLAPGQSVSGTLAVGGNDQGRYSASGRYNASAAFSVQTGQDSSSLETVTAGPLPVDAQ